MADSSVKCHMLHVIFVFWPTKSHVRSKQIEINVELVGGGSVCYHQSSFFFSLFSPYLLQLEILGYTLLASKNRKKLC